MHTHTYIYMCVYIHIGMYIHYMVVSVTQGLMLYALIRVNGFFKKIPMNRVHFMFKSFLRGIFFGFMCA